VSALYDAKSAECRVTTYREGALAAMGHDLVLRFTDLRIEVRADLSIEARVRADSIAVIGSLEKGTVNEGKPSPDDRRNIERDAKEKVLEASRYPEAIFRSRSVKAEGEGWRITGYLDLHGAVRDLAFTVERRDGKAVAKFSVNQPAFNIKPFKAALGALRVKPDVDVEVSTPLPAPAEAAKA
jgi:hypothetical protein